MLLGYPEGEFTIRLRIAEDPAPYLAPAYNLRRAAPDADRIRPSDRFPVWIRGKAVERAD